MLEPPKVIKKPHKVTGVAGKPPREDPYYWLRDDDRSDPEVLVVLKVTPPLCCIEAACLWPRDVNAIQ